MIESKQMTKLSLIFIGLLYGAWITGEWILELMGTSTRFQMSFSISMITAFCTLFSLLVLIYSFKSPMKARPQIWSVSLSILGMVFFARAILDLEKKYLVPEDLSVSFMVLVLVGYVTGVRWHSISKVSVSEGDLRSSDENLRMVNLELTKKVHFLKESEQRFQRAIEYSPLPCILYSESGNVLMISKGWTEFSGYRLADIPDVLALEGIMDRTTFQPYFARDVSLGEHFHIGETRTRTKNGELRIWDCYLTSLGRFEDGQKLVLEMAVDITDRKRIENDKEQMYITEMMGRKAVEAKKELLQAFVKFNPLSVGMFDLNLRFLAMSAAWMKTWKEEESQLIGRSLYDLYPHLSEKWHQIHGECLKGKVQTCEEELLQRDDGRIEWMRWHMQPWHTENGEIGGIFIYFEDITQRKLAEQERINQARQAAKEINELKQALDKSSIVAFTDARGIITYVNDKFCEISQYSRDELIGRSHAVVNSGFHDSEFFHELWKTIAHGNVWSGEIKNRAKDGTYYWVLTTIIPFLDEKKRPYQYVAIRTDITQQKILSEERVKMSSSMQAALQANRLKSEFLAVMSHEVRTPINGVIGMTNLLLDTNLTPHQRDFSEAIKKSADDLLLVINDILDFSKIEAGRMNLERVSFDLIEIMKEKKRAYAYISRRKGLSFFLELPKQAVCCVYGDPGRLRQVMNNLLANAFKFTENGSITLKLLVDANENNSKLRFEITDTGIGIPLDAQEFLFEPFTQADLSTSRRFGGTGLGLSISKRLVQMMNGRIGLQSAPGVGSTF